MNTYRMEDIEVGHKESFVTTVSETKMGGTAILLGI